MLHINLILKNSNSMFRIIWSNNEIIYWIDIYDKDAWPEVVEYSYIVDMLISKELKEVDDPYLNSTLKIVEENSKSWDIREKAWGIINKDVESDRLFTPKGRGARYKIANKKFKIRRQAYYSYIRSYWQKGLTKNTLIPNYDLCGGKGKPKCTTGKKLGRPRTMRLGTGCNVTEDIQVIFRKVIDKEVLVKKDSKTIVDAHILALNVIKVIKKNYSYIEAPTVEQFRYFFKKEYSIVETLKRQFSESVYNKDLKPITGSSTTDSIGPGFKYQIDATIADIYLVSTKDRECIVGRPVIYVVIDVMSRLATGLYIGFEGPSWVSAMLALANTVENKVDFCQKYGVSIDHEEWPVQGLPSTLLADKGEFLGANVDTFASAYGIRIENAVAQRGDAKGIVEKKFDTIQSIYKPYAPGVVESITSIKKGGRDYKKDAKLNIDEFTKIIIRCVLWHNNDKVISKYDRDEYLPTDIPAIPIRLWNWGLANLTGKLRNVENKKLLRINLMPHKKATTSDLGIYLFGCYYTCPEAIELGWFHRKTGRKHKKVLVAYDMRYTNNIYIRPNENLKEYWVCNLSIKSRRFKNITFWEAIENAKQEKKTDTQARQNEINKKGELLEKNQDVIKEATLLQPDEIKINSKNGGQNIKNNKELEKQIERQRNLPAENSIETTKTCEEKHIVANNIYSFPDFSGILFEGESDE